MLTDQYRPPELQKLSSHVWFYSHVGSWILLFLHVYYRYGRVKPAYYFLMILTKRNLISCHVLAAWAWLCLSARCILLVVHIKAFHGSFCIYLYYRAHSWTWLWPWHFSTVDLLEVWIPRLLSTWFPVSSVPVLRRISAWLPVSSSGGSLPHRCAVRRLIGESVPVSLVRLPVPSVSWSLGLAEVALCPCWDVPW